MWRLDHEPCRGGSSVGAGLDQRPAACDSGAACAAESILLARLKAGTTQTILARLKAGTTLTTLGPPEGGHYTDNTWPA